MQKGGVECRQAAEVAARKSATEASSLDAWTTPPCLASRAAQNDQKIPARHGVTNSGRASNPHRAELWHKVLFFCLRRRITRATNRVTLDSLANLIHARVCVCVFHFTRCANVWCVVPPGLDPGQQRLRSQPGHAGPKTGGSGPSSRWFLVRSLESNPPMPRHALRGELKPRSPHHIRSGKHGCATKAGLGKNSRAL